MGGTHLTLTVQPASIPRTAQAAGAFLIPRRSPPSAGLARLVSSHPYSSPSYSEIGCAGMIVEIACL